MTSAQRKPCVTRISYLVGDTDWRCFVYLLLFDDIVSSLDYMASNGRVINEKACQMNWKECGRMLWWPDLSCQEEMRKTMKHLSKDNRSLGRSGHLIKNAGMLTTRPELSITDVKRMVPSTPLSSFGILT
jgi:hypothetical protein